MTGYILHLDESIRGRLLSVGGFICSLDDIADVRKRWASLRQTFGLARDDELKWNWPANDPARAPVEARGWNKKRRNQAVVDALSSMPITLMADLLYDERGHSRGPLDFYRYGVDYVCVGFRCCAVYERQCPGPHIVVVDKPSPPPKPRRGTDDSAFEWLKDREEIWHVHYRRLLWDGPKGSDSTPLYKSNFYPALLVSQAKYNRLLEIADAVSGLALDFAEYNLKGVREDGSLPPRSWQDQLMADLASKFRRGPNGKIRHYGFTLFPEWIRGGREVGEWLDTY